MEKDNIKEFVELYNIFDDALRRRYNETNRSFSVITRYINHLEKTSSVENYKKGRKLNMIRILRNNLVHEFDFNSEALIKITDETIEFLQNEIDLLKNPITAYDISTKLSSLYYAEEDSIAREVLINMTMHGFTQIPILNNGKLVGVFTPNVLFAYIAKNGMERKNGLTIKDFLEFLPCEVHVSEKYAFIERNAFLDDVLELFDDSHRENKKLAAIFVTEHGLIGESILGMIVPTDIIQRV